MTATAITTTDPMTEEEAGKAFTEWRLAEDARRARQELRMTNATVARVRPAGGYRETGKRGHIHIDVRAVVPMVTLFTLGIASITFLL